MAASQGRGRQNMNDVTEADDEHVPFLRPGDQSPDDEDQEDQHIVPRFMRRPKSSHDRSRHCVMVVWPRMLTIAILALTIAVLGVCISCSFRASQRRGGIEHNYGMTESSQALTTVSIITAFLLAPQVAPSIIPVFIRAVVNLTMSIIFIVFTVRLQTDGRPWLGMCREWVPDDSNDLRNYWGHGHYKEPTWQCLEELHHLEKLVIAGTTLGYITSALILLITVFNLHAIVQQCSGDPKALGAKCKSWLRSGKDCLQSQNHNPVGYTISFNITLNRVGKSSSAAVPTPPAAGPAPATSAESADAAAAPAMTERSAGDEELVHA